MVYHDASKVRIGMCAYAQGRGVAYASQQLKFYKENDSTHDMELAAIVYALRIWRYCLYGVTIKLCYNYESLKYM